MNKVDEVDFLKLPMSCPVCGSDNTSNGHGYTNIYWKDLRLFNKLDIISCGSCGFGFSWPEIPDIEVKHFYVNNYRCETSPYYVNFNSLTRPLSVSIRSLSQLLLAKKFVTFKYGDCFIDIGPGAGMSFDAALLALPSPKCGAIELNVGAASAFERIYGIQTYASVTSFIDTGKKAKICLLSHSLEHYKLSWLAEYLEELKSVLCEGGVLVVEVPHVDMRIHSELREDDAPHFLFFSTDSVQKLFKKYGWNVLFCNSVENLYDKDKSRESTNLTSSFQPENKFKRLVKNMLKKIFPIIPKTAQQVVRCIVNRDVLNFSGAQFSYGGNRTCLRLVVTPCKKNTKN